MYTVRDLDNRQYRISTFSERMARDFWEAIVKHGDTPVARRWQAGVQVPVTWERV